jgi:CheY-like chemotaxis protein
VTRLATVLIVEDEFAIADLLELVLTDHGYTVVLAGNGRQGLERLAEGPLPDLVICDYMMPILDGVGLMRAMQDNVAQRDIPCVVMTSLPEATIRARITRYAAYLQKPFQLATMVQVVTSILDGLPLKD